MSAGERVFDPGTLAILKAVFEDACSALPPGRRTPSVRLSVAERILSKASQGERDPVQLRTYALNRPCAAPIRASLNTEQGAFCTRSTDRPREFWTCAERHV